MDGLGDFASAVFELLVANPLIAVSAAVILCILVVLRWLGLAEFDWGGLHFGGFGGDDSGGCGDGGGD
jgi:hypothetical protein